MAPIPVPAPPLTPPRYSLLTTTTTIGGDSWGPGWEDRITWEPECMDPDAAPVRDNCDTSDGQEGAVNTPGYRPVVSTVRLSARDVCSTMGANSRDWQGRARRLLAATESAQLAKQLWSGAATASIPGDETPYLADGNAEAVDPVAGGLVEAVAALEASAAVAIGRPWLHMGISTFTRLLAEANGAVLVQGGVATTVYGSVLVTDAGYPSGLDDEIIYATSPVYVRLGDVAVYGDDASGVDRSVNNRSVWAQRYAVYQFEDCARYSISIASGGD